MRSLGPLSRRLVVFLTLWLPLWALSCAQPRAVGAPPAAAPAPAVRPAPADAPAGAELALAQSIPEGLPLRDPALPTAAEVWRALFRGARSHIELAQFYVQSAPGEAMAPVLDELVAAAGRGVRVRVLLSTALRGGDPETQERLKAAPGIEVRYLDLTQRSGGILHAKYLLLDDELLYIGSQNFDWRSLSQIHELGVRVRSAALAQQLGRIFALDWKLAAGSSAEPARSSVEPARSSVEPARSSVEPARSSVEPARSSVEPAGSSVEPAGSSVEPARSSVEPARSSVEPAKVSARPAGGSAATAGASAPPSARAPAADVELVASPPTLLPPGTRPSIDALVELLRGARRSVRVQLLKYSPFAYRKKEPWPVIDRELRAAAARGVAVQLMVSDWNTARPAIDHLKALSQVPGIEVRIVSVPALPGRFIPHARVIHSKYLIVDEQLLWIGTANWEPEMFLGSRNLELIIRRPALAEQAARIFRRLWSSPYAAAVEPAREYTPPRIK